MSKTRTTLSNDPPARMYSNWGCHWTHTTRESDPFTVCVIPDLSVSYRMMLPLKHPIASMLGLSGLKCRDLTDELVGISTVLSNFLSPLLNLLSKAASPVGPIASQPFTFQSTSKMTLSLSICSYQRILFFELSNSFIFPADVTITTYLLKSSSLGLCFIGHHAKDYMILSAPFACLSSMILSS